MISESIERVMDRMRGHADETALYWKGEEHSYEKLFGMIEAWRGELERLDMLEENGHFKKDDLDWLHVRKVILKKMITLENGHEL